MDRKLRKVFTDMDLYILNELVTDRIDKIINEPYTENRYGAKTEESFQWYKIHVVNDLKSIHDKLNNKEEHNEK